MATRTLQLSGDQLAAHFGELRDHILWATLAVDEAFDMPAPFLPLPSPLTDEEFLRTLDELAALAVDAPHADFSREAMYTRREGE